jgi:hypothetical protein
LKGSSEFLINLKGEKTVPDFTRLIDNKSFGYMGFNSKDPSHVVYDDSISGNEFKYYVKENPKFKGIILNIIKDNLFPTMKDQDFEIELLKKYYTLSNFSNGQDLVYRVYSKDISLCKGLAFVKIKLYALNSPTNSSTLFSANNGNDLDIKFTK